MDASIDWQSYCCSVLFWHGDSILQMPKHPGAVQWQACAPHMRTLAMLNRAAKMDELRVSPGSRLEALQGGSTAREWFDVALMLWK